MAVVGNTKLGNHYNTYIYMCNNSDYIYICIFFNQYRIVVECCRKYASIIHMDASMIKETVQYMYKF